MYRFVPGIQIFKNGQEVANQRGWPGEAKLREMLIEHGAALEKKQ